MKYLPDVSYSIALYDVAIDHAIATKDWAKVEQLTKCRNSLLPNQN